MKTYAIKMVMIFAVLFCLLPLHQAYAWEWAQRTISDGSTAVAASADYSPQTIFMKGATGYCFVQLKIEGDGTAKVEAYESGDGTTFAEATGASDILSGITKTSGSNSDGNVCAQAFIDAAPWVQIVITETGGADTITPTCTFYWQTEK